MTQIFRTLASLGLVAGFVLFGTARAQVNTDAIERLSTLVAGALPMGSILQPLLDKDPTWPLTGKADRVAPSQLQCLRQRLSPQGYRDLRREEVIVFANRYPDRVEGAIRVLELGGAEIFAATVQMGVEEGRTGRKADYNAIGGRFSPAQMSAFLELIGDDKHKMLREVIGIDDTVRLDSTGPENERRGRSKGMLIGMKLMLAAMDYCKLPLAAVQ